MKKMNILVVGGGNIGTTLACYIKNLHPEYSVRMYVRDPSRFGDLISLKDTERSVAYDVRLDGISDDPAAVACGADVVYVCLPHFAVERAFRDIAPFVSEGCLVGVVPGSGGCEFYFDSIFGGRARLFGFQRVPFVARLIKYGHSTNLMSWKPYSVVGTLRYGDLQDACSVVKACGLRTVQAANYLAVSLAPSNPIIHTACIYGLFSGHTVDEVYPNVKRLYEEWGDEESSNMLAMDAELHSLFEAVPNLDMSSVRPLCEHYESPDARALTRKILSIPSFKNLLSPMKAATNGGTCVDLNSRMFTEDFPFGLAIIRGFGELFGMAMPTVDKILSWYSDWTGADYYESGRFAGKGLSETGIPQNYGIRTPEQVMELYGN